MNLLRGGIVLLDPTTSAVTRTIVLQYNPDSLSRSFKVQQSGEGDHLEVMRLKGPPVETIKIDAELDAADQANDRSNPGVYSQIAALETIIYPPSRQLQAAAQQALSGILEIMPAVMPLTLFIWSRTRVLPVRLTEMSVTEEAFDSSLNPLRAKVSLGMRVLTTDDMDYGTKGASLYLIYQQQKERLARGRSTGDLSAFGIKGLQ
jgi:hypothetical protein